MENEYKKQLEYQVFPSDVKTISVLDDAVYGGAHEYIIQNCTGFSNGNSNYVDSIQKISFVKKLNDGTIIPGLQSEQIVYMLIDRHKKLNKRFPSKENEAIITGLQMVIDACESRVKDRIERGVMGDLKK